MTLRTTPYTRLSVFLTTAYGVQSMNTSMGPVPFVTRRVFVPRGIYNMAVAHAGPAERVANLSDLLAPAMLDLSRRTLTVIDETEEGRTYTQPVFSCN